MSKWNSSLKNRSVFVFTCFVCELHVSACLWNRASIARFSANCWTSFNQNFIEQHSAHFLSSRDPGRPVYFPFIFWFLTGSSQCKQISFMTWFLLMNLSKRLKRASTSLNQTQLQRFVQSYYRHS